MNNPPPIQSERDFVPNCDTAATSEARMRALLEAAVDGIISINARGIIQMINPAAERMFGHRTADVIGQNVKVLMPHPYRNEHDEYLVRYLTTGEKRIIGIGREALGQRKDGTVFPIELSVAEAHVAGERIFVGIIRDISARKEAEKAIRRSHEELETAVAELRRKNEEIRAMTQQLWQAAKLASVGELAASIAHELNNPLATIRLRVESAITRTSQDDPRRRALEIVDQESKRMGDLVANLLQFSRRGAEQVSTVDVRDELIRAVELVQHHLRSRSVAVVQRFAPETPTIYGDRQKLRQVFLNLLTNAADAMPHGGTLTLMTKPAILDPGRSAVVIEVTDTGVGIPPEWLERAMVEPFFTTKEEGKGTGLGLAICRRVAQDHKGAIEIESKVGAGTTVRVILPIQDSTNVEYLKGRGD